ncbi:MAG: hypothetical protein ABI378_14215 [Chitinophagaceae bacterium]
MRLLVPSIALLAILSASCNNTSSGNKSAKNDSAAATPITLKDVPASPQYPDAQLSITSMKATPAGKDSTKISFNFGVKNYELMAQTADANSKECSNSDKGQHIHFILDNKPYAALYEPKYEVTVPNNTEHELLCFLSRSYHESVKSPGAMTLTHFKITDKGALEKMETPKTPMLFYSRPKGDYLAKDTSNVLLDFYPVNATLGADYKVKAEVKNETNGKTANFTIDNWKANFLEGLGTGTITVNLILEDKSGAPVSGEYGAVSRTIHLAASEPMKN